MAWYSDIFKPESANQPAINAEDYLRFKDEYGREPRQGEMPTENIAPASYLAGQISGSSIAGGVPGPRYGSILAGELPAGVKSGNFIPSWGQLYKAKQRVRYVAGDMERLPITPEGGGTAYVNTKKGWGAYAEEPHMHSDMGRALKEGGVSPETLQNSNQVRWNREGGIDFVPRSLPEEMSPLSKMRLEESDFRDTYNMLEKMGMIPKGETVKNWGFWSGGLESPYSGIYK